MENYEEFFMTGAPDSFVKGITQYLDYLEDPSGYILYSFRNETYKKRDKLLKALSELGFFYGYSEFPDEEERAIETFLMKMEEYTYKKCKDDNYRYGLYVVSVLNAHLC